MKLYEFFDQHNTVEETLEIDEGLKDKILGLALAAGISLSGNAMADDLYTYTDSNGKTHAVKTLDDLPPTALDVNAVDLDSDNNIVSVKPVKFDSVSDEKFDAYMKRTYGDDYKKYSSKSKSSGNSDATVSDNSNAIVLKSVVNDDPMISKYSINADTVTLHLRVTDDNLKGYIKYSKNARKLITPAGALEYFGYSALYKKKLLQKLPGIKNIEFKHNL